MRKSIDIAVNLTDSMFRGVYRGKSSHADDFAEMITRAKNAGVEKIIATGTDLEESRACIELAKQVFREKLTRSIRVMSTLPWAVIQRDVMNL
jgi:Tat protein secretion system quality control protein TatD with DNase activity